MTPPTAAEARSPAAVPAGEPRTPPDTLTPVTAAATPVSTTEVRTIRAGSERVALCLPGARCRGTYFSGFDAGVRGTGELTG